MQVIIRGLNLSVPLHCCAAKKLNWAKSQRRINCYISLRVKAFRKHPTKQVQKMTQYSIISRHWKRLFEPKITSQYNLGSEWKNTSDGAVNNSLYSNVIMLESKKWRVGG